MTDEESSWDREVREYQEAIGQGPAQPTDRFQSYHQGFRAGGLVVPRSLQWWFTTTAVVSTPTRWSRLKGTVSRWVRNGRKWLAQKIAGRNFDIY